MFFVKKFLFSSRRSVGKADATSSLCGLSEHFSISVIRKQKEIYVIQSKGVKFLASISQLEEFLGFEEENKTKLIIKTRLEIPIILSLVCSFHHWMNRKKINKNKWRCFPAWSLCVWMWKEDEEEEEENRKKQVYLTIPIKR